MKNLQLKQSGNLFTIWDNTTNIYSIDTVQSGSSLDIKVKNAYDEEILSLLVQHSGFKLFRTNKISSMKVHMNHQEGSIIPREHSYEWMMQEVSYTFVCGELAGSNALIMSDHEDTLGYASKDGINLQHMMYSAELCAFFVYLMVSKDKIQLDTEKFARAYAQVQS